MSKLNFNDEPLFDEDPILFGSSWVSEEEKKAFAEEKEEFARQKKEFARQKEEFARQQEALEQGRLQVVEERAKLQPYMLLYERGENQKLLAQQRVLELEIKKRDAKEKCRLMTEIELFALMKSRLHERSVKAKVVEGGAALEKHKDKGGFWVAFPLEGRSCNEDTRIKLEIELEIDGIAVSRTVHGYTAKKSGSRPCQRNFHLVEAEKEERGFNLVVDKAREPPNSATRNMKKNRAVEEPAPENVDMAPAEAIDDGDFDADIDEMPQDGTLRTRGPPRDPPRTRARRQLSLPDEGQRETIAAAQDIESGAPLPKKSKDITQDITKDIAIRVRQLLKEENLAPCQIVMLVLDRDRGDLYVTKNQDHGYQFLCYTSTANPDGLHGGPMPFCFWNPDNLTEGVWVVFTGVVLAEITKGLSVQNGILENDGHVVGTVVDGSCLQSPPPPGLVLVQVKGPFNAMLDGMFPRRCVNHLTRNVGMWMEFARHAKEFHCEAQHEFFQKRLAGSRLYKKVFVLMTLVVTIAIALIIARRRAAVPRVVVE